LQVTDDEREKLKIALASLLVLDAEEVEAEKQFSAAIRPFLDAEARGRELFATTISEEAARSAAMSMARG
jgi:hypothetical protein